MRTINHLDLFSGVGGFSLGLKRAGVKVGWHGFSDIDKHANKVFKRRFPDAEELGSVESIKPSELPRIDLITFGFPCQDLSIAGKRKGFDGSRSSLFFESIKIIEATKPQYFVFENVKGFFSSNDGKDFAIALGAVADIGYDGQWQLLNTRWFLPQNRERVYFVGHIRGECRPKVFPIGEVSKKASGLQRQCTNTLTARYRADAQGSFIVEGEQYAQEVKPVLTPDRAEKRQNGRRFKEDGEDMFTLTSQDQHGVMITEATKKGYSVAEEGDSINLSVPGSKTRRGRVRKGEANTLDTGMQQYTMQSGIRRLTPTECERLQGFPDGWTDGQSDTQRYKQMGNAVSVPVVKAVMEKLYIDENF